MSEDKTISDTKTTAKQGEVDRNFAAFAAKLPELLEESSGKHALMRHGEIIAFFDTANDAVVAGTTMYEDGLFSVQEVVGEPADLGFFSHAVPLG